MNVYCPLFKAIFIPEKRWYLIVLLTSPAPVTLPRVYPLLILSVVEACKSLHDHKDGILFVTITIGLLKQLVTGQQVVLTSDQTDHLLFISTFHFKFRETEKLLTECLRQGFFFFF